LRAPRCDDGSPAPQQSRNGRRGTSRAPDIFGTRVCFCVGLEGGGLPYLGGGGLPYLGGGGLPYLGGGGLPYLGGGGLPYLGGGGLPYLVCDDSVGKWLVPTLEGATQLPPMHGKPAQPAALARSTRFYPFPFVHSSPIPSLPHSCSPSSNQHPKPGPSYMPLFKHSNTAPSILTSV
jgi:hypothetical protein